MLTTNELLQLVGISMDRIAEEVYHRDESLDDVSIWSKVLAGARGFECLRDLFGEDAESEARAYVGNHGDWRSDEDFERQVEELKERILDDIEGMRLHVRYCEGELKTAVRDFLIANGITELNLEPKIWRSHEKVPKKDPGDESAGRDQAPLQLVQAPVSRPGEVCPVLPDVPGIG